MRLLPWILCLAAAATGAHAAEPVPDALPVARMETLVVHGEQPGPGLWRISRDGHELWLLGTVSPLPKRMQWNTREVEEVIAVSQEVLMAPGVGITSKAGFFANLLLLPKALKARNNPEGVKLQDVLPVAMYARWSALKQRYLGRGRGIEKRRPIVAAEKLQKAALDDHDLSLESPVEKAVRKAAKRADAKITEPRVKIEIEDPKALLKELVDTPLDDVPCFERILDRLERDIETLKLRANAWALGEIGILRRLPYTDATGACLGALLENRIAARYGFTDLRERVRVQWQQDAEAALAANTRSFAVLPMAQLLETPGYLDYFRARGYLIEAPAGAEDAVGGADAGAAPADAAAAQPIERTE